VWLTVLGHHEVAGLERTGHLALGVEGLNRQLNSGGPQSRRSRSLRRRGRDLKDKEGEKSELGSHLPILRPEPLFDSLR
jgi:hypothetical protein